MCSIQSTCHQYRELKHLRILSLSGALHSHSTTRKKLWRTMVTRVGSIRHTYKSVLRTQVFVGVSSRLRRPRASRLGRRRGRVTARLLQPSLIPLSSSLPMRRTHHSHLMRKTYHSEDTTQDWRRLRGRFRLRGAGCRSALVREGGLLLDIVEGQRFALVSEGMRYTENKRSFVLAC
jgi:hypothetical protein